MGLLSSSGRPPQMPGGPVPGTSQALGESTRSVVRWMRSLGGVVPARAMALCWYITDNLESVANDPSGRTLDAQTYVTLERTASAHLPDTLQAYLGARGLPNAEQMLIDQLMTLQRATANVIQRQTQQAQDALAIQGSFLKEKFGDD